MTPRTQAVIGVGAFVMLGIAALAVAPPAISPPDVSADATDAASDWAIAPGHGLMPRECIHMIGDGSTVKTGGDVLDASGRLEKVAGCSFLAAKKQALILADALAPSAIVGRRQATTAAWPPLLAGPSHLLGDPLDGSPLPSGYIQGFAVGPIANADGHLGSAWWKQLVVRMTVPPLPERTASGNPVAANSIWPGLANVLQPVLGQGFFLNTGFYDPQWGMSNWWCCDNEGYATNVVHVSPGDVITFWAYLDLSYACDIDQDTPCRWICGYSINQDAGPIGGATGQPAAVTTGTPDGSPVNLHPDTGPTHYAAYYLDGPSGSEGIGGPVGYFGIPLQTEFQDPTGIYTDSTWWPGGGEHFTMTAQILSFYATDTVSPSNTVPFFNFNDTFVLPGQSGRYLDEGPCEAMIGTTCSSSVVGNTVSVSW